MRLAAAAVLLIATGCGDKTDDETSNGRGGGSTEPVDADGDGIFENNDCDDADAAIYPGADEICDGIDNDCDDEVDEDAVDVGTYFADADGDGYGAADASAVACGAPEGFVEDDTDCDDDDAGVNPGADEVCNGIDDDCDGLEDDADDSVDTADGTMFYGDADEDGYGDAEAAVMACAAPEGFRLNSDDCDDTTSAVNPGATEVCNDIDDDCDGLTDDLDDSVDLSTTRDWYADADGDGYGAPSDLVRTCAMPSGHVGDATDCDDADAAVNPAATEICDADDVDEDCDGTADDDDGSADTAGTGTLYYPDADTDGYGDATDAGTASCDDPSTSSDTWLTDNTDCDDADAAVSPAATEVCDADDVDEDCDGTADDDDGSADTAGTGTLFYPDADTDGYGDATDAGTAWCDDPSTSSATWLTDNTDCDDIRADVNPAATEICDADDVDEDCDGTADDDDSDVAIISGTLWYPDGDGDGYGDADDTGTLYCDDPSAGSESWLSDNTDCDDSTVRVSPAAAEICDGLDNDCDATTTEDGMAAFADITGAWTDETTSLTSSGGVPVEFDIDDDGTLYVCDGTWTWNLTVSTTAADILGVNGSSGAIIDGGGAGSVLTIGAFSTVSVSGITLQNGASETNGGGIFVDGGMLSADDVVIAGNTAESYGGGIYVDDGGSATLIDCEIMGNSADRGGGGFTDNGSALALDTCVVDGNEASTWGGGLEVYQTAELSVLASTISDNTADAYGGGIECNANGLITITDSEIVDNIAASANGGGIDLYSCDVAIEDSLLDGNSAGDGGGGVYADSSSVVIADGLELAANTATDGGGLNASGELDISNSDIYGNVALSEGGGFYVDHDSSPMSFSAVDFSANTPSDVYSADNSTATSWGLGASFSCDGNGCF